MRDEILFQGNLFQVVNREKKYMIEKNSITEITINYEFVRRPPGVRAIICNDNQILLNREFRYELNDWDYRLPGGKIFDSYYEYKEACINHTLQEHIISKLKSEVLEEADITVNNYELFYKSQNGLTVEWDLYYFIVTEYCINDDFFNSNRKKNDFEYIDHCWFDFDTIKDLIMQGKISEDRSIGVILKYILLGD